MKSSIFLFLFTFFANHSLMANNDCRDSLADEFSVVPLMSSEQNLKEEHLGFSGEGPLLLHALHPGDPLLHQQKRSIRFLNAEQLAKFKITPERLESIYGSPHLEDYYIFANFIHGEVNDKNSRFWLAIIPQFTVITNVFLNIEWFIEGAGAHFQYRMKFSEPITLLPQNKIPPDDWHEHLADSQSWSMQDSLSYESPMQISGDIVHTLLALRTQQGPQDWGPVEGVTGAYANAYAFQSTLHTALVQSNRNWVEQVELFIPNQETVRDILNLSLNKSHTNKESDIYNTVYNSCVTSGMEALYANGLGYSIDKDLFNPYRIIDHFTKLGYVKNDNYPSLNEEFNSTVSFQDINQEVSNKIEALLPIIKSDSFDLVMRGITSHIVIHQWSHVEITTLFKALTSIPAGANLIEANKAIKKSIADTNLSNERKKEIKSLGIEIFNFILEKLDKFDPQLVNLVLSLTQQD
ncbi:MAG: hypothetical protein KDD40_05750 [Bdellovibrionales bacterium]|nr:hypothetical protein [Bdellovibrionales bacterium]